MIMKVLKNYAYNLSYQLLVIILPIITTPYVTRVFSSNDLGTYGYFNSIVTYFLLLATLGVANYGTKEISGHRKDIQKNFWGIYTLQLGATILSLTLYVLLCLTLPSMQNPVAYILGLSLVSKGLDISWLFQGLEDFRKITVRNITVKLVGVISIFLFVKSANDLYLYVFLLTIFELLGQLSMWLPAREFIGKAHFDMAYARVHLKPVILLFLPQIAISLYVTLDRTMLGALASTKDVGIYDQALKLVNILLTLVTSLGSVMLPRVSSLLSSGDQKAVNKMHQMSFLIYNLVIFPIIAGMLIVNDDFVQFFLGKDFQDARYAIAIMIFRMFFIGWTNIMGIQILIPHNKNKEFMISTTVPAIVSVGLNLIFLPKLGFIGAAIVSVLTEALVWGIQLYFTRTYLKEVPIMGSMMKIVFASGLMYGLLLLVKFIVHLSPTLNVVLYAGLGGVIYGTLILLFKVVNVKELKQQLIKNRETTMYDYLIVGAGLSGAIFAHEATKRGKKVKVIDKRDHIGGNIYCEEVEGINVHKYGAHIFHTSNKKVWDYVNQFAEFNNYINSPVANYKGRLYNLPFNMNTFYAMWGTKTPQEVKNKIAEQTADMKDVEPKNLEEQAIKLIGLDIYEKLIKGYTEKQWGRSATDLPPFIIKRLPVRLTFDNNYFNDRYQGIPIGGYNVIIENMLGDVEVELGVDFFANREELEASAEKIVFTGMIDQYFDYKHGELEYRSLRFEHEVLDEENHQGNAVVNYTEREIPYTRIIEHKHFEYGTQPKTVITREYPADWKRGDEPYYPINDEKNNAMFAKYQEEASKNDKVIFCGRLADYKYYDMHVVIERALEVVEKEFIK